MPEKVYNYHPVPDVLTAEQGRHILGIQANLWTEYITTLGDMEYMLYPRVAVLAEVGWSKKEHQDYTRFCSRLTKLTQLYDVLGIDYCKEEALKK